MTSLPTIIMPKTLCLYQKDEQTLSYLNALYSKYPVIRLDFSYTEEITAAAALALVAHVNNIQRSKGNNGCFVFDCKKSPIYKPVFIQAKLLSALKAGSSLNTINTLFQFGGHENFAEQRRKIFTQLDEYEHNLSPKNKSAQQEMKQFFSYLRTSISEVLLNIRHHAYPATDVSTQSETFSHFADKSWWCMFWHGSDNYIHFLVYDLGIGIPSSYVNHSSQPRNALYDEFEDANILQEAWQYGMSRFIGAGRGNGLGHVVTGIKSLDKSMLLIRSGYARGRMKNGKFTASETRSIIQGTLIEWAFCLPE